MKMSPKLWAITAGACLSLAVPAMAAGPYNGTTNPGSTHRATPGPSASAPTKAKAYGKYCQNQSKKHVAGQKGTPFSQCVTAMARVAHNNTNPTTACRTLSHKKAAGQTKTPYAKCVSDAAKLQNDLTP